MAPSPFGVVSIGWVGRVEVADSSAGNSGLHSFRGLRVSCELLYQKVYVVIAVSWDCRFSLGGLGAQCL